MRIERLRFPTPLQPYDPPSISAAERAALGGTPALPLSAYQVQGLVGVTSHEDRFNPLSETATGWAESTP
jgi:hypothetical protein